MESQGLKKEQRIVGLLSNLLELSGLLVSVKVPSSAARKYESGSVGFMWDKELGYSIS